MSNAEEKSCKASTDMLPLLRERNRSLTTFRRAVSVLFFQYCNHPCSIISRYFIMDPSHKARNNVNRYNNYENNAFATEIFILLCNVERLLMKQEDHFNFVIFTQEQNLKALLIDSSNSSVDGFLREV